jgi:hypothetical protein
MNILIAACTGALFISIGTILFCPLSVGDH